MIEPLTGPLVCDILTLCEMSGCGGIGRHAGLRNQCLGLWVRVPLSAPAASCRLQSSGGGSKNPNLITRRWGSDLSLLSAPETRDRIRSRVFLLDPTLPRIHFCRFFVDTQKVTHMCWKIKRIRAILQAVTLNTNNLRSKGTSVC